MMSFIKDGEAKADLIETRDAELGLDTAAKREHRKSYLPRDGFEPSAQADRPSRGRKLQLQLVEV